MNIKKVEGVGKLVTAGNGSWLDVIFDDNEYLTRLLFGNKGVNDLGLGDEYPIVKVTIEIIEEGQYD